MIGRRCKGGDVLSRPVLIARYLFRVLSFCPSDLSQVTYCGGYGGGDPPLPIPNREVKPAGADGSAPPGVRVGSCRFSGVPETIRFVPGTPSFMPATAGQRPHGLPRRRARPSGPRHNDYVQPRRYRPGAGHVIAGGECRLSDFVLDIVPVAVTGRACDHLADESCKEQHDAKHDGEKRQIE